MRKTKRWAVSCVGILALSATGCGMARGGGQTASSDPATREVQASQQQAEQAMERAREAQKKASEQAGRAADAQREVQEAQQRLAQAQEKAREEQEKAQQLQREASQANERATQEARQAQQQASQALARQTDRIASGEQVLSGQVLQATGQQVVVRPRGGGDPMTFAVNEQTRVQIGARQGSASDLRQGEDARVSYEVSGTEPRAISIQVLRADEGPSAGQPTTSEQPRSAEQSGSVEQPRPMEQPRSADQPR